jgi:hypothetical protein
MSKQEIVKNGIEFKLDVSELSEDAYEYFLSEMQNYIAKQTNAIPKYIGDWEITIKAKDIEFEQLDDFSVDMFFVVRKPNGDEVARFSGAILDDQTITCIIEDVAQELNKQEVLTC